MKFASRIQPFVAVTRQEADAIEMDQKITRMLANKRMSARTKSRLLEDSMARLNNFRQDYSLAPADAPVEAAAVAVVASSTGDNDARQPVAVATPAIATSPSKEKKKKQTVSAKRSKKTTKSEGAELSTAKSSSKTWIKAGETARSKQTKKTTSGSSGRKVVLSVDSPVAADVVRQQPSRATYSTLELERARANVNNVSSPTVSSVRTDNNNTPPSSDTPGKGAKRQKESSELPSFMRPTAASKQQQQQQSGKGAARSGKLRIKSW